MPSKPRPLARTSLVRVRHPKYGEKNVQRSRLGSLSSNWSRVKPAKSSANTDSKPSVSEPVSDPGQPDSSMKEQ